MARPVALLWVLVHAGMAVFAVRVVLVRFVSRAHLIFGTQRDAPQQADNKQQYTEEQTRQQQAATAEDA